MAPPRVYRNVRRFPFNVESDMFKEFEEICWQERKSATQKLNELIEQMVRGGNGKDALAFALGNGGNGSNGRQQLQEQQTDIREWLSYKDMLVTVRKMVAFGRLDEKERVHIGNNLSIIGQKMKTGFLHKD